MNKWEWQLLEAKRPVEAGDLRISGVEVRVGSRVRLRPKAGGDIMDIALANKTAIVESIEQDYDGKFHFCVVVDDDPGRDIGLMRQPGHRFFFDAEEVDPVVDGESLTEVEPFAKTEEEDRKTTQPGLPRILIAGIGNIFLGDDAFGVEVVRRLSAREMPANVKVVDFGIRGYDLAFALLDGYDVTILVDACPRGGAPGTLYVIEPDATGSGDTDEPANPADAHTMNPLNVLRLASSMAGTTKMKRVLIVGCEPGTLGPEEGQMGLSDQVEAVIDEAVNMVESLVGKIRKGELNSSL